MRTVPVAFISAITAVTVNIVIDTYTDISMPLRWGLAIAAGLLVTVLLSHWFKRRDQKKRNTTSPSA